MVHNRRKSKSLKYQLTLICSLSTFGLIVLAIVSNWAIYRNMRISTDVKEAKLSHHYSIENLAHLANSALLLIDNSASSGTDIGLKNAEDKKDSILEQLAIAHAQSESTREKEQLSRAGVLIEEIFSSGRYWVESVIDMELSAIRPAFVAFEARNQQLQSLLDLLQNQSKSDLNEALSDTISTSKNTLYFNLFSSLLIVPLVVLLLIRISVNNVKLHTSLENTIDLQERSIQTIKENNRALNQEIKERKAAQQEVMESEMKMSQIIDFLPDPTFAIDLEGKVLFWNRAIEELTGIASEDMVGKSNFAYAHPFYLENRPILIDLVLDWDDQIASKYEYIKEDKNSLVSETKDPPFAEKETYFWNAACKLYDTHGSVIGAIETIRDITEIKRSEKALRESEFRFRAFFDSNPEGIVITDLAGNVIEANKSFYKMTGFTAQELYRRPYTIFSHPNSVKELASNMQALIKGIRYDQRLESLFVKKDGTSFPADIRGWIITDEGSKPIGIGVFIKDASREKKLVDEKLALEKQLQHTQKMEAIGTLAGGIAHDFNNILSAILGYTELSLLQLTGTEEKLNDYLNNVLHAAEHARELTRRILSFSRQDSTDFRPVSMLPLIKEVSKLIRSTLPATISVQESFRVENDLAWGDATQIHQIVMNLCTNAYHAMRDQGGTLTILMENHHLEQTREFMTIQCPQGSYIRVKVSDTGPGIAPEIRRRIFEPYFTTKTSSEGTGLGLSVTYGIVKNHRGLIEVDSTVGEGTTFTIYLPVSGDRAKSDTPSRDPLVAGNKERLLLVDDEAFFLDVVSETLEGLDYNVTAFQSSVAAIDAFRKDPGGFDAVITDQSMPEMTGLQLVEEIRKVNAEIPIVLCTGYSDVVTEESAAGFQISKYLMKPVTRRSIAAAIDSVLSIRKNA